MGAVRGGGVKGVPGGRSGFLGGYRNQRKSEATEILKIIEFLKGNIGLDWSRWVPEDPENAPRGHRNTPKAVLEDLMDY